MIEDQIEKVAQMEYARWRDGTEGDETNAVLGGIRGGKGRGGGGAEGGEIRGKEKVVEKGGEVRGGSGFGIGRQGCTLWIRLD